MCCGSKRSSTRGTRSGKITRARKIQVLNTDVTNDQYIKDRERSLILPISEQPDQTRNLEPPTVQGS